MTIKNEEVKPLTNMKNLFKKETKVLYECQITMFQKEIKKMSLKNLPVNTLGPLKVEATNGLLDSFPLIQMVRNIEDIP